MGWVDPGPGQVQSDPTQPIYDFGDPCRPLSWTRGWSWSSSSSFRFFPPSKQKKWEEVCCGLQNSDAVGGVGNLKNKFIRA